MWTDPLSLSRTPAKPCRGCYFLFSCLVLQLFGWFKAEETENVSILNVFFFCTRNLSIQTPLYCISFTNLFPGPKDKYKIIREIMLWRDFTVCGNSIGKIFPIYSVFLKRNHQAHIVRQHCLAFDLEHNGKLKGSRWPFDALVLLSTEIIEGQRRNPSLQSKSQVVNRPPDVLTLCTSAASISCN